MGVDQKVKTHIVLACPRHPSQGKEGDWLVVPLPLDLVEEDEVHVGWSGVCPTCGGEFTLIMKKEVP